MHEPLHGKPVGAGGNDLPLRDLIDGIEVKNTLSPRRIALMHAVHAQIAGLAVRIGPSPFSDGDGGGPGRDVVQTPFPIARLLAQLVEVRHRDRSQPLELALAIVPILALQNAPRGGSFSWASSTVASRSRSARV
jgi:hypothetical protein